MQIFLSLVVMGLSALLIYQAVKLRESRKRIRTINTLEEKAKQPNLAA